MEIVWLVGIGRSTIIALNCYGGVEENLNSGGRQIEEMMEKLGTLQED